MNETPEGPPPIREQEQPSSNMQTQLVPQQQYQESYSVPTPDDKTMAMLIHLLSLLSGFVGPLILWLVKKDTSLFVDFHGKESINFMITNLIISFVLLFLTVITLGLGALLFVPYIILLYVFEIMACVKAYNGEWYRIPMTFRFIK